MANWFVGDAEPYEFSVFPMVSAVSRTAARAVPTILYLHPEHPKMLSLSLQPVGVAAQPPNAVSRSSAGILLPTRYIASTISEKGTADFMPLKAVSALVRAFAAPDAFRL